MQRQIKAYISGCAGTELTASEKELFRKQQPWGLILFQRNCASTAQLAALTADFRDTVGRKDAPVMIDQEGGRVQRMKPEANTEWRKYPPAARFGEMYAKCPLHALRAARNVGRLMAADLEAAGITVNCLPVLDVPQPRAHAVISDRAYDSSPEIILTLARAHVAGFLDGGVLPVMKHIPGHGRATVDSHKELPRVSANRAELEALDFRTFAAFADCPMAMSAHVVFEAIDKNNPATLSKIVIRDVIRKQLGYNGLLMTDDLSMKALSGSFAEKTAAALNAGCDVVLHCNGVIEEMEQVAEAAIPLAGKAMVRAKAALKHRRKPQRFDTKVALKDWETVMEAAFA
ncbi:MAG: beta-N-acetylhexosaminidase [Candidatus Aminicenantales bacterium]